MAWTPEARAQCDTSVACNLAASSLFVGDLNSDELVNAADMQVLEDCFLGMAPPVCRYADLNFDGVIDDIDREYLASVISLSGTFGTPALPRATLSEIRVRKPEDQTNPQIPQSRYVEIRTPELTFTVNGTVTGEPAVTEYKEGWYYLKICRTSPGAGGNLQTIAGTIAVVQDLEGMRVIRPNAPAGPGTPVETRGLSLLVDDSFTAPLSEAVPTAVRPFQLQAQGSLEIPTGDLGGRRYPVEWETNVTHLIVYRDPSASNSRDRPAVGQRVNARLAEGVEDCRIAFDLSGSDLPPWDAIVDAVTLVRGSSVPVYGCIFAEGPAALGPIGTVQAPFQPQHVYRCRNAGTLTRGPDAVVYIPAQPTVPVSDTPFKRNPACTSQVTNCGELSGDGEPSGCFDVHPKPFCSDPDCCIAVCTVDPSCCTSDWDSNCVQQARDRCITCGSAPTSCFIVHPTPACESAACCEAVCAVDPSCCDFIDGQWDQDCVQAARELCLGCGGLGAGSCDEVRDLPYCNDADCCNRVCEILPTCCSERWDQACVSAARALCPGCGRPGAGSCCIIHGSPYCDNGDCCNAVCALDPFCCGQTWDYFCTRAATALPECEGLGCTCGNPAIPDAPFSCFVAHPLAGCEDAFCCQSVCIHDPYCCFISWDDACVELAILECSTDPRCIDPVTLLPVTGSCFIAHPDSPGCDKPGCCSEVCADEDFSYCCDKGWDEACAVRATDICDNCGDPLAGSCYQSHVGPYCANRECCQTVCLFDPFCCEGTWDGLCVQTAETLCGGPLASCVTSDRSCFIPNYLPGCKGGGFDGDPNVACCEGICTTIDPFCCDARWDAVCAREAAALCSPPDSPDVPVGPGSCLEAHATPACANEECSLAVCTVDPSCCATGGAWDVNCVLAAMAVCPTAGGCPAEGDCFSAHPNTAGCRDSSCCNGVCSVDPACCSVSWDDTCASIADVVCMVPTDSGWSCPCAGSCFEPHENPGCDDGSCCAVVCNINPACCDASWTEDCTSFARTFCCGAPGCDSGCNKGCLTVHPEPYCNDPFCCDAVCRADPLCCLYSWDSLCATGAMERCAGACGLATAGDCFIPQAYGGCREASCCGKVCAEDPVCCSEEWDQVCVDLAIANPNECHRRECGEYDAGPSCRAHPNGASDDKACCTLVCAVDSYCCATEWDDACVDIALGIEACGCTFECGDPCAGDCCSPHDNPSCDDEECCDLVCAVDDYCCTVIWDAACAAEARNSCTGKKEACPLPPCGSDLLPSCCVPGNAPNCKDADCCAAVCQLDPFCCEIIWDVVCSELALGQAVCECDGPACGDPDTGSCTEARLEPYCNDAGCCVFVCDLDPSCCAVAWDEDCVLLAEALCVNAINAPRTRKDPTAGAGRSYTPPAGWIPVRQRMQQRRPYPADLDEDVRPATEAVPVPRPADRSPSAAPGPMQELPEAGALPSKAPAPQAAGAAPAPVPAGKKPGK
jgi:hypothetical protein